MTGLFRRASLVGTILSVYFYGAVLTGLGYFAPVYFVVGLFCRVYFDGFILPRLFCGRAILSGLF